MTDDFDQTETSLPGFLPETVDKVRNSTNMLGASTTAFAGAMRKAFADATAGGKQFDDLLKQLALRLSNMAVTQALNSAARGSVGSPARLFDGLFDGIDPSRQAIPFAAGGVIGAPSYFPLAPGSLGLAGEAGPEAIVPLRRGPDGRLGVAMSGAGQPPSVTVHIAAVDAQSFQRSEAYITGQIARAVARGQRGF